MKNKLLFWFIIFTFSLVIILFFFATSGQNALSDRIYKSYTIEVPNSTGMLIAMEWVSFKQSGIDFYYQMDNDKWYIESIKTDEYCPFELGNYKIRWNFPEVTIYYQYSSSKLWKELVLSLSDPTDTRTADSLVFRLDIRERQTVTKHPYQKRSRIARPLLNYFAMPVTAQIAPLVHRPE